MSKILDELDRALPYDTMTLESLGTELTLPQSSISMEGVFTAIGSMLGKLLDLLKEKLFTFFSAFQADPDKQEKEHLEIFKKSLAKNDFKDMMEYSITIPARFKGSLKDYSAFMRNALSNTEGKLLESLAIHKSTLGSIVNTNLESSKYAYYNKVKKYDKEVLETKKAFGNFYKGKSSNDISFISEHFKNSAEIEEFVLNLAFYKMDEKMLDKLIAEISLDGHINAVRKLISKKSADTKVDKDILKDISNGLYVLAEHVEFLAVLLEETSNVHNISRSVLRTIVNKGV